MKIEKRIFAAIIVFTATIQVYAAQFDAVYTDKFNQLRWSRALPGKYSNGCLDAGGEHDQSKCTFEIDADGTYKVKKKDSNASKACPAGSRLPTKSEYESLIRNFDHYEVGSYLRLTDKGIADMQSVFGDMNNLFWTSSVYVYESYPNCAFRFYGLDYGGVDIFADRISNYAVRCVAGPLNNN